MQDRTWTTKPKYPESGNPWDREPDKAQFSDPNTGMPCLIVRNHYGALCGYVGVAEGHPYYGVDDDSLDDLSVHGGVTFTNFCDEDGPMESTICHIADPGEPEPLWWIGFDCGHAFDLIPDLQIPDQAHTETYRTVDYVKGECARLAEQLVKAS